MKIRAVESELFHTDGQTDRHDKANSRFRNFATAPKKQSLLDVMPCRPTEEYRYFRGSSCVYQHGRRDRVRAGSKGSHMPEYTII